MSFLVLQASRWIKEGLMFYFGSLFGAVWPLVFCVYSSRCHRFVYSVWLWHFLGILTYFYIINDMWCEYIAFHGIAKTVGYTQSLYKLGVCVNIET